MYFKSVYWCTFIFNSMLHISWQTCVLCIIWCSVRPVWDPDFRSQRTHILSLTRVKGNSDFWSDQSPCLAHVLVQKTETPDSQMNWVTCGWKSRTISSGYLLCASKPCSIYWTYLCSCRVGSLCVAFCSSVQASRKKLTRKKFISQLLSKIDLFLMFHCLKNI